MTAVLSVPKVEQSQSLSVRETLMRNLDELLEQYLDLVHQYHILQQSLAKDFSSVG